MSPITNPILSRRWLLGATMGCGGALVLHLLGCSGRSPAPPCSNPDQLSDEQVSLRTSLGYTERAPDKQRCSDCAFYKAQDNAVCGDCELLKGPVNPQGHCNSWSTRPAAPSASL